MEVFESRDRSQNSRGFEANHLNSSFGNLMRTSRQISLRCWLWLLTLASPLSVVPVYGQINPPTQTDVASTLQNVYREAEQHQAAGRWGDALSLYEKALKQFPDDRLLQHHVRIARANYDVNRRVVDGSYIEMVRTSDLQQALTVYGEVLADIQMYHVDAPDWKGLIEHGIQQLDASLRCPGYQKAQQIQLDVQQIQAIIQNTQNEYQSMMVDGRMEARTAAELLANSVSRQTGLKPAAVVYEFLCGAVSMLDTYSGFLTTDQYNDQMSQIDGNFVGLGVELRAMPDSLDIVNVIKTGPADRGGIVSGDQIIEVDRQTVTSLGGNQAADLLRGPEGSPIELVVRAPAGQIRRLRLERQRVEIPSVEDIKIIDRRSGAAYFKLSSFQRTSRKEVVMALWQLHRQGMRSLIIDLRGNPGGLLDAAVDIADLFLEGGTIVSTKGRNPDEDSVRSAVKEGTWTVPLIVIIDGDSASASEIFAGAIRDHRRGIIVGQRSYGKGSVQGIFDLKTCTAGVRLTTAKFFSPSGKTINLHGVSPDVPVQVAAKNANPNDVPADNASFAPNSVTLLKPDANGVTTDPFLSAAVQQSYRFVRQQ